MIRPPKRSDKDLDRHRTKAIQIFRRSRLAEPRNAYLTGFDSCSATFEQLLKTTNNLEDLRRKALDTLASKELSEALRYVAGPPVSKDDLQVLANVDSLAAAKLESTSSSLDRIIAVIEKVIDRRRFPWVAERRSPTNSEKNAAVLASAALLARSRRETARRNDEKIKQETAVESALLRSGMKRVAAKTVANVAKGPQLGKFCRESRFGNRKADFLIRLWDNRLLAVECRASNSYTNSIKRLNREAAGKARAWLTEFGSRQVVATAVLGGVYKLFSLQQARDDGLAIFWDHDLRSLTSWIKQTRSK